MVQKKCSWREKRRTFKCLEMSAAQAEHCLGMKASPITVGRECRDTWIKVERKEVECLGVGGGGLLQCSMELQRRTSSSSRAQSE